MDKPKPYISAALLCERVLIEKDEVITAVRVIDKVSIKADALPEGLKPAIMLTGLIGLKSGPAVGDFILRLSVIPPSGEVKPDLLTLPANLKGGDHGQNFVLNLGLGIESEGLYWFEVFLDDVSLTKIPLTVTIEPRQTQPEQK